MLKSHRAPGHKSKFDYRVTWHCRVHCDISPLCHACEKHLCKVKSCRWHYVQHDVLTQHGADEMRKAKSRHALLRCFCTLFVVTASFCQRYLKRCCLNRETGKQDCQSEEDARVAHAVSAF
jgi:hypothetical protein